MKMDLRGSISPLERHFAVIKSRNYSSETPTFMTREISVIFLSRAKMEIQNGAIRNLTNGERNSISRELGTEYFIRGIGL